jgi:hypothetical protein
MRLWSNEHPFESAQVIIKDNSGRLFFHKNRSIVKWEVKLTLFWWKVEEDDKNTFSRVIEEVREEAWVVLLPANLQKQAEDWPKEFEKWWFLAHVYLAIVFQWTGDIFRSHKDTHTFDSKDLFDIEWRKLEWGTSFEHVKWLVDNI